MPTAAKAGRNMTKNLTNPEREARAAAEAETLPTRASVRLIPPPYVQRDSVALQYWQDTVGRMDGITLLDDLDTEMLGIYCSALARRDELHELCRQLMREALEEATSPEVLAAVSNLDTLTAKLQRQEAQLLQYADKLGLTPGGRVRLAQRRAEARTVDPDDDLFGA